MCCPFLFYRLNDNKKQRTKSGKQILNIEISKVQLKRLQKDTLL